MTVHKPAAEKSRGAYARRMCLCPNCRTIQKAGTSCSICKCPVHPATLVVAQAEVELAVAAKHSV